MTLTSLLICLPEFNLERELCNTSVLSSYTTMEKKLNICWQVGEKIKGMDICYIKRNHYN